MRYRWTGGILGGLALGALGAGVAAAEQVTITFFVRDEVKEIAWEKDVIPRFEAAHPNIKVDLQVFSGGDDAYVPKLLTLFAAGTPPDVWGFGGEPGTERYHGFLLDLHPYIERDKAQLDESDIFPGAWNAYVHPQSALGMPFISLWSPLYYNEDLFDAAGIARPPVDWDDSSWNYDTFAADARKLTKTDPTGKVTQWGAAFEGDDILDSLDQVFPWLNGGGWFDQPGTTNTGIVHQLEFNSPQNIEAYQRETSLVKNGSATFDIWDTYQQGIAAMGVSEGGWIGLGTTLPFKEGMAPEPWMQTTADPIYTDAWLVSSQTKHPNEAWEFAKYLGSAEAEKLYVKDVGASAPVRNSVIGDYAQTVAKETNGGMTAAQVMQSISGGEKYGRETQEHVIAGWEDYTTVLNPIFANLWAGKIDAKTAMLQAEAAAKPVMEKYLKATASTAQ